MTESVTGDEGAKARQAAATRRRRIGPREVSVDVTLRYRLGWLLTRLVMRTLFDVRAQDIGNLPPPPYLLACNHHNGMDPLLVMAVTPLVPRITWFGPRESDFSRGFKNRAMTYFGGVIPYNPEKTTLTSAVRAVRRAFTAGGVLGIFAEGRIGFRESELLPFEEGAAGFAAASRVPVVPCAVVGSTRLWFRRRIRVRFGPPLTPRDERGAAARQQLETDIRDAVLALLPGGEPRLPAVRPLQGLLTDLLNGREDVARRPRESPGPTLR